MKSLSPSTHNFCASKASRMGTPRVAILILWDFNAQFNFSHDITSWSSERLLIVHKLLITHISSNSTRQFTCKVQTWIDHQPQVGADQYGAHLIILTPSLNAHEFLPLKKYMHSPSHYPNHLDGWSSAPHYYVCTWFPVRSGWLFFLSFAFSIKTSAWAVRCQILHYLFIWWIRRLNKI